MCGPNLSSPSSSFLPNPSMATCLLKWSAPQRRLSSTPSCPKHHEAKSEHHEAPAAASKPSSSSKSSSQGSYAAAASGISGDGGRRLELSRSSAGAEARPIGAAPLRPPALGKTKGRGTWTRAQSEGRKGEWEQNQGRASSAPRGWPPPPAEL